MTDLVDRTALDRNRAKASVMFLHHAVQAELQERLTEVNRVFTAPAVVSGYPGFWGRALPGAVSVADDDTLSLTPGAHDLVVHALALHWANDPVGQIVQCRRALAPDGLFIAMMFGGQTLAALRVSLAEAETRLTGGLSPRVLPMGEIRDLGALLQRAGLALPVADSAVVHATYPSALHLMGDLRAMGESNALFARHRRFAPRALFAEASALYAQTCGHPDGRVTATFDVIWLTGWAPAGNQPKPLRPGSATTLLADALRAAGPVAGPATGSD